RPHRSPPSFPTRRSSDLGIRTPQPLTEAARKEAGEKLPSLEALMPETFAQLTKVFAQLERRYRDMQDIEFTIQEGKLWMLQTRSDRKSTRLNSSHSQISY